MSARNGGGMAFADGVRPGSDVTSIEERWQPPGPGTWTLDTAHVEPTVSRVVRDALSEGMGVGLREGFEMLGAPLAGVDASFVNGRFYTRLVPLIGGARDLPDPPRSLLWLVTRLHPAFRRRARQSIEALETRMWLIELDRWNQDWKPTLIERNRGFGAVDLRALDDDALADHLDALWAHLRWSTALHFRLHCSDLGPIGRLLVAAEDWGLDPSQVMSTLAGSSPSTSAPSVALSSIRRALDCDPGPAGAALGSLEAVRAAGGQAADLLDAYLADYGPRLTTGYDICDLTLEELPELVLASILEARVDHDVAAEASERGSVAFDELRARVPVGDHAHFDLLVDDARLLYGLRDENGPLTYQWPAGLLRRAVLEIAERLVTRSRIAESEHIFDARADEMSAMLRGRAVPDADELAERHAQRMSWSKMNPPTVLGRPATDPPVDVLPGQMPLLMRAVITVMALLENAAERSSMSGVGIGDSTVRGVARVVTSAEDAFDRVDPGDILVTRLTVPTYNAVLAMAGGVVTEHGGLLSHTAVIARELGIPAIVGVAGAMRIPDGAQIELDPTAGEVRIIS